MSDMIRALFLFALTAVLIDTAYSIFVNIDANAEECFHDKVTSGTKMSLMFEVSEGGFLDIDIKVYISDVKGTFFTVFIKKIFV